MLEAEGDGIDVTGVDDAASGAGLGLGEGGVGSTGADGIGSFGFGIVLDSPLRSSDTRTCAISGSGIICGSIAPVGQDVLGRRNICSRLFIICRICSGAFECSSVTNMRLETLFTFPVQIREWMHVTTYTQ